METLRRQKPELSKQRTGNHGNQGSIPVPAHNSLLQKKLRNAEKKL
jgi:hypothetical protein